MIDFEYAGANTIGLEFANHFSEWTYDYHDSVAPYACHVSRYPNTEEQYRFIRAYVDHRPQYSHGGSTPNLTPLATPLGTPALVGTSSSSSIIDFMLDARTPPGGWNEEEARREEASESRVRELMEQTRLWRVANSAQWVAWGIIQAKIPGLTLLTDPHDETGDGVMPEEEEVEADEFDYLAYSQDRAMFFWSDCVSLGLASVEELPKELVERLKFVKY